MINLYLYPGLFGLPDNNPFGLKVDTFFRLAGIDYFINHVIDTSKAPRKQLPYITYNDVIVTDSNHIIKFVSKKLHIDLDKDLNEEQKTLSFLITRMLDTHLYWIMSYSRWHDKRYWPLFKNEFLKTVPEISEHMLDKIRSSNLEKFNFQGIGRYQPEDVYNEGITDIHNLTKILGNKDFLLGREVHLVDASCYGFLANIYYYDIDTPLKDYLCSNPLLVKYVNHMRELLKY